MNLLCPSRNRPFIADDYATSDDFRELFSEGMTALHLLAYLLTGDQEKAEQCFVTGLEDSVNNSSVFKEWARSWAQRAIVQSAIRMVAPPPDHAAGAGISPDPDAKRQSTPARHAGHRELLALGDFERFVFVLSVLERYSDQDCSTLLRCSREDVRTARMRVLLQISEIRQRHAAPEDGATVSLPGVSRGGFANLAVKTCTFKQWPIGYFSLRANIRRKFSMAIGEQKTWQELCRAALGAKDPDELLEIVLELNKSLKHEEQVRRDFREASKATSPSGELRS